jgi:WD40 repeat protein
MSSPATSSLQAKHPSPDDATNVGKHSLWRRLLDFVFGYDFFISYSWSDGGGYASALTRQLRAQGFEIFLDRDDYASGDDWKKVGAWKLRRTSQLVLIGSPAALVSAPVIREIQIFSGTGRRIVPIDFDGSLEWKTTDSPLAPYLPAEILRIREPSAALEAGPSEQVIATLRRTFNLVRQDKKRLRVFAVAAVVLGILAVAAAAAAWFAWQQRNEATRQAFISAREAYAADLELSDAYRRAGDPDRAVEMLRKHVPGDKPQDLREFAWRYLWRLYDSHRHAIFVSGQPTGLDLSPDGTTLAIANDSALVSLWDIGTGQQVGQIVDRRDKIKSVIFVAGGTHIATRGGGELRLWDRQRPAEPVATMQTSLLGPLSSDRGTLITNAASQRLQFIDARTGEPTPSQLTEDLGSITNYAIGPDRRTIAVVGDGKRVFVFDAQAAQVRRLAELKLDPGFRDIDLTPDGALLIVGKSADEFYEIVVRDVADNAVRARLRGPAVATGAFVATAVSQDGSKIALLIGDPLTESPKQNSRLVVFDARTGRELYALDAAVTGFVTAMAFSPTADVLAIGNRNHELTLWDATAGRQKALLGVHHNGSTRPGDQRILHKEDGVLVNRRSQFGAGLSKILFSPDGGTIVTANAQLGSVRIWNANVDSNAHALPGRTDHQTAVAFSPDGSLIATGGESGDIATWRAKDGSAQSRAAGHQQPIDRIAFSATGETFASASEDGAVKLWRAADLAELGSFRGAKGMTHALMLRENRLMHFSGPRSSADSKDLTLTSWPLSGNEPPASKHFPPPLAVLSANGERIAFLDEDENKHCRWTIWNAASDASRVLPLDTKRCSDFDIQKAAWSPDGKLLAFGGPAVKLAAGASPPELSGVRIYDIDAGNERRMLPLSLDLRSGALAGLEFSPDGRTLATLSSVSGGDRGSAGLHDQPAIILWDVGSSEKKSTFRITSEVCKDRGVECIKFGGFSADGNALAAIAGEQNQGLGKSETIVWRLDDQPGERFASDRPTYGVAMSRTGERVATVMVARDLGAPAMLWDRKTGDIVAALGSYRRRIDAATRSPDNRVIAQTLEYPLPKGTVSKVWDLRSGDVLAAVMDPRGGEHRVTDVAPNGELLAAMDERGRVVVQDVRERRTLSSFDTNLAIAARPHVRPAMAFGPEGRTLIVFGAKETAVWDVRSGARLHKFGDRLLHFFALAGDHLAIGDCTTTSVYDMKSGKQTSSVPSGQRCPNGIALSPDGAMLLSLVNKDMFDGTAAEAKLWKLDGTLSSMTGYDDAGAIGAFSRDGRTIATAGPDGAVNFWDAVTSRRMLTVPGFKEDVSSLHFSDDGRVLVVGYAKEVRVWHAAADPRMRP